MDKQSYLKIIENIADTVQKSTYNFNWKYYLENEHFQDDALREVIIEALEDGFTMEQCEAIISGTDDVKDKIAKIYKFMKLYDPYTWNINCN
jgi:hypothetical protein